MDSTYLKTASQAGLTKAQNREVVKNYVREAIDEKFKLIMLRPDMVAMANEMVSQANSKVCIGTVIDFPDGNGSLEKKLNEANMAIADGADDLDFVVDYEAFKQGEVDLVKKQVLEGTRLGLSHNRIVKWIIEVAALDAHQIVQLTALIKNVVIANFKEEQYASVFVKSSTGFYKTEAGLPNGATTPTIKLMIENAFPLPVKAAGGVRSYEEAMEMISLGVKRIGTSSAKAITDGQVSQNEY
ncbi:deoxyribose-phosphate aldolase [Flavobacterium enshiense DK69]|nr:deoxyribose-phosphate aldolase [Flavobacterium enshiense DK69]